MRKLLIAALLILAPTLASAQSTAAAIIVSPVPATSGSCVMQRDAGNTTWVCTGVSVSTVTVADTTSATTWVGLFEAATGSLAPKTDGGLTFNATTGVLTATGFAGPLTGAVTGNVSGTSGSTTGNAATATALAADPADCGANTWANTINASGTLGCTAVTYAGITAMSSANFAGLVNDETGSGLVALATSPTFLGVPTFANGATSAGGFAINEDSDDGANWIKFQAQAMAANLTYTWPAAYPTTGQVLSSTDAGVMSWADGGAGGGAATSLNNLAAVAINADLTPGTAGAIHVGSATKPVGYVFFSGSSGTPGTNNFKFIGASTSGTREVTFQDASGTVDYVNPITKPTVVALTDGATPALDASLGTVFYLDAAGNRTIAVPTNPVAGQKIVIAHYANAAARTLALNTGANGFLFGSDVTALTETASGKTDFIGAIWLASLSKWAVVAVAKGY